MGNSSSFFHWNFLPAEIKMMIIKHLGNNCRLALRACSRNDKELVDAVKFRKLHYIELRSDYNPGKFILKIRKTKCCEEICMKFDSFDIFQQNVINEIEGHDYIEEMLIDLQISVPTVMLSSTRGNLVKIRNLSMMTNINIASYLEQVDSFHLNFLQLCYYGVPEEVFDIPLVKTVKKLKMDEIYIRDDQLLKMKNQSLYFSSCQNLTLKGINKYIQKCAANLDDKQIDFSFECFQQTQNNFDGLLKGLKILSSSWEENVGKAIVSSKSKKYQSEVECSDRRIRWRTYTLQKFKKRVDPSNCFTIANDVEIENFDQKYRLTIRKNSITLFFSSKSSEEIQVKLIEEIKGINYIKHLLIRDHDLNWKFCSENKQITVGILNVFDGTNIVDYLKQIEPVHLKGISIHRIVENQEIYDLQKIVEVENLTISDCRMNDAQLLQLNAVYLHLEGNENKYITYSGINAFFKKCISNLNKYPYNIRLIGYINENDTFGFFEGLDVLQSEKKPFFEKVVLDSPYSEYQMRITILFDTISAKRIKRYIDNEK